MYPLVGGPAVKCSMNCDPNFSHGIEREPDAVVDTVRVSVSWYRQHRGQC